MKNKNDNPITLEDLDKPINKTIENPQSEKKKIKEEKKDD